MDALVVASAVVLGLGAGLAFGSVWASRPPRPLVFQFRDQTVAIEGDSPTKEEVERFRELWDLAIAADLVEG